MQVEPSNTSQIKTDIFMASTRKTAHNSSMFGEHGRHAITKRGREKGIRK